MFTAMKNISDLNPKKNLTYQLRQIGDALLSTPAIRLLNERYPDAQIHVLTEKKCASVLENNPRVNHIWQLNKAALSTPSKVLDWYAKVRSSGYDLTIDFQQLLRSKWPPRFSRVKVKRAFTSTPFVTVDPSLRRETWRYPANQYGKRLNQKHPNLRALLLYGPGEKSLVEKVALEASDMAVVPQDMLSLRKMAATQKRAVMVLRNCSSPRNFAIAVGIPSVTIQGATTVVWRFPGDDHLSLVREEGCVSCNSGTLECLREFTPKQIFSEIKDCMDEWLNRRVDKSPS